MTGRLDRVDLQSDLVLVFLEQAAGDPTVVGLYARLLYVDTDSFVFDDVYADPDAYIEDLRMFESLGFLEMQGHNVQLTGHGSRTAAILKSELTDDQDAALRGVPA